MKYEQGVKPADSNLMQISPAIYPGAGWQKERRNDGTVLGFFIGLVALSASAVVTNLCQPTVEVEDTQLRLALQSL